MSGTLSAVGLALAAYALIALVMKLRLDRASPERPSSRHRKPRH
ncbi:hypothetical protein [Streptomyces sp. 3212.3]|nr:hypothetical protein [Streptomyces sp. 3212.3]